MGGTATEVSSGVLDVLLVDDVADVRRLLKISIDGDPRFRVVGEAEDGVSGIELARSLHPDVIVLDVLMPGLDGLEALPRIREVAPDARVVVLSGRDEPEVEDQALALGAVGYLEKGMAPSRLVEELVAVAGALDAVGQAVAEARRRLGAEVRSAGSARRFVEATLERWDCVQPLEVVKLLVSELVTNAVVHAHSDAEVIVRLTPMKVHIEVLDRSPVLPVVRQAAHHDTSGRGMALVAALSSSWGTRPLPHGKAVWFEVPRTAAI
ncbi:MAG TPA: response regulator [Acidimicrobiales bacterium]|nr:response regulator [Acidimicrobiales bacterium]